MAAPLQYHILGKKGLYSVFVWKYCTYKSVFNIRVGRAANGQHPVNVRYLFPNTGFPNELTKQGSSAPSSVFENSLPVRPGAADIELVAPFQNASM